MKQRLTGKRKLLFMVVAILVIGGIITVGNTAFADTTTYYLYYKYQEGGDSDRLIDEVITEEMTIMMQTNKELGSNDKVVWSSDNSDILSVEPDTYMKQSAIITPKRPGVTVIRAQLYTEVDGKEVIFTADCQFTVKLEINDLTTMVENIGHISPLFEDDYEDSGSLLLEENESFQLKLKYGEAAPGDLSWFIQDETVATVSDDGTVRAVSGGVTTITVSTYDAGSKRQKDTIRVVVKPKFQLNESSPVQNTVAYEDPKILYTNAKYASSLIWVVRDENKKVIVDTYNNITSDKISLVPSDTNGTCKIDAKAGNYTIEVYPKSRFNEKDHLRNVDSKNYTPGKAEVTMYVNFSFPEGGVNIGDQFNLYQNSNVYDIVKDFEVSVVNANYNSSTGLIDFNKVGTVAIIITKRDSSTLPTKKSVYTAQFSCVGTVNTVETKTLFVGESVQLPLVETSYPSSVKYVSSNPKIATVTELGGLVTGISEGNCVVNAVVTTYDGVIKYFKWNIIVLKTFTATLTPGSVEIDVDEMYTIHATFTPNNINYVNVKWKSSNTDVVEIIESEKGYVKVKAKNPGIEKIVLVNTDNVELAFCTVIVREPLKKITFDQTSIDVVLTSANKNPTYRITPVYSPTNATNKTLVWTSSNPLVATVDSEGFIKVLKAGYTEIKATSVLNREVFAVCKMNVYQQIQSFAIDTTSKTMNVGDTHKIVATFTPEDYIKAEDKVISWVASDPTIVSITTSGVVANVKALKSGTVILTAETTSGLKKQCTITVLQEPTSIKLSSNKTSLNVGDSAQLTVAFTPATTTVKNITYKSTNEKYLKVDTSGKITAAAAPSNGEVTVTVQAMTSNGKYATIDIKVTQPVTDLKLNYAKKVITKGKSFTLTATISPSNAVNKSVKWTSQDPSIASVSNTGVVTAKRGGSTIISCKSLSSGKEVYCLIVVQEKVTSISLNTYNLIIGINQTYKIKPTIKSNYSTNQKLTFTSSNKGAVSISSNGTLKGLKLGYSTITVRATDGSNATVTCKVRVVRKVSGIRLNKSSAKLIAGKTLQLKASITPTNATIKSVTWTSSNDDIAYVDTNGRVTGVKAGKVKITAKAKDQSGRYASCIVQVVEASPAKSVSIVNKNLTMIVGEKETFKAIMSPGNTSDALTWYSDDSRVVSINKTTGKITAKRTGTATITVSTTSGKTATTKVTVIGLSKTSLTMEQYDTYKLKVIGGGSVQWDVDNSKILRVSSSGKISARKKGTTYVTAKVKGRILRCKVKVTKIK